MRIPISPYPHQFLLPFFFFFNFSHLRGHEEVSHCGLELNFPKSSWHWTSFYMLVGYVSSFEKCIFKRKWKWKLLSRARLFATLYSPWNSLWDSIQPMNSPGQNTGVGSVSHFQGIFPGIKSFFHMAGGFFTSWATREGLQSLKPFLSWVTCLLVGCKSSLHILDTSPLLDLWFIDSVSHFFAVSNIFTASRNIIMWFLLIYLYGKSY